MNNTIINNPFYIEFLNILITFGIYRDVANLIHEYTQFGYHTMDKMENAMDKMENAMHINYIDEINEKEFIIIMSTRFTEVTYYFISKYNNYGKRIEYREYKCRCESFYIIKIPFPECICHKLKRNTIKYNESIQYGTSLLNINRFNAISLFSLCGIVIVISSNRDIYFMY